MKNFIVKNNLYLITALSIIVAIITFVNWSTMPFLQRMVCLFFLLHLWEEGKFPGGFTEMITKTLNFTASNRHFGETITAIFVLLFTVVPLIFSNVVWLTVVPTMAGIQKVAFYKARYGEIEYFDLAHYDKEMVNETTNRMIFHLRKR
jgi:hypothetical protein